MGFGFLLSAVAMLSCWWLQEIFGVAIYDCQYPTSIEINKVQVHIIHHQQDTEHVHLGLVAYGEEIPGLNSGGLPKPFLGWSAALKLSPLGFLASPLICLGENRACFGEALAALLTEDKPPDASHCCCLS